MKLKGVIFEDLVNYKNICMTLEFPKCSFKCDKECGQPVCQNGALVNEPDIEVDIDALAQKYLNDPITSAICCQGLEPFDSWEDLQTIVRTFRDYTNDTIIIYTGYNKEEIVKQLAILSTFENIVIKYGRYIPGSRAHCDPILNVMLASDNQYAERIS